MSKIKLVLADVDGTLVTHDKVLTNRAIAAVKKMREQGIGFAITSGRPPKGMQMLVGPLEMDEPVAGFNGGMFVSPDLKDVIEAHTLPRATSEKLIGLLREAKLDPWVYAGDDWLIGKAGAPHVEREAWTVKFQPKVVDDFAPFLDDAVKIVGVSDNEDDVAAGLKAVQDAFGDQVSAAPSQPYYLDITHPLANKGAAVKWLSKHLDIPLDAIATIGDQPNDVLMFRESGLSIAMGNASDEVKGQAKEVTDSSEDEGFAKAMERFVLGEDA
ncbi:hypothetical protein FHR90_001412 [Endobacter medicaginis]|uniref:HAD family phosphatase n=1 Tax=Endobacter medicaginis TaxID=1181271 RepID=A0A850NM37_9PROT|nr:Cof-type HAD-IIB family hydrolase [Endobacter medicaginis]MBB3173589.1 hypothetical protein [Endobacter medicaginis]MCX5475777.1 Cof-type HAD-IIB family hydrolase [Endobacter medicaginis]NVN29000.1 HAD family phosphatase [Endobacter medicaginis]